MKQYFRFWAFTLLICAFFSIHGYPANLVSYQGTLTNASGIPVNDSTYNVTFTLLTDSTGGLNLWTETAPVSTKDGLFVHLLGSVTLLKDSLFQNYQTIFLELSISSQISIPRHRLTTAPFAITASNLKMKDKDDKLAATTDANKHSISIFDTSQTEVIRLSGTDTSNLSVVLPDSAVDNLEILDEPGLTASFNINQVALFTGEMTDLVTVEITTPADGYILLHGKCYLLLSGTTGPNNAFVQIDEDEGGPSEFPYYTVAGLGGYVNTGTSYFPIYVTRIFFASAGTYLFRMEGRASFPPPAEAKSWDHFLTAVYYPTAYDAVKSLVTSVPGVANSNRVTVLNRSDSSENGTYYELDLRNLEKTQPK
ncbi:MAG TPA: hypothetical protein VHP63_04805 [candidate division Zixibacteria bacterium]|nr:hypothetical protein [candidate division Zixibacteria bacterium]